MSIVERALAKAQRRVAEALAAPAGQSPAAVVTSDAPTPGAPADVATPIAGASPPRPHKKLVLDRTALREAGMLAPVESERRLVEEYRRIKRPVVGLAVKKTDAAPAGARVVMVASALPNEGKTFTALNLALSMAREKDLSVLLIDADIAKAHLSFLLGIQSSVGFLDALRGDAVDVEDAIYETDVPGLLVLPTGTRTETDTEHLASRRMNQLAASLVARDPRRVVILDSPPLLLTNDSRELASAVDQVVLVVRAGVTPRQVVFRALDALGNRKPIGLVLTQAVPAESEHNYYGYGSYGNYGVPPDA